MFKNRVNLAKILVVAKKEVTAFGMSHHMYGLNEFDKHLLVLCPLVVVVVFIVVIGCDCVCVCVCGNKMIWVSKLIKSMTDRKKYIFDHRSFDGLSCSFVRSLVQRKWKTRALKKVKLIWNSIVTNLNLNLTPSSYTSIDQLFYISMVMSLCAVRTRISFAYFS